MIATVLVVLAMIALSQFTDLKRLATGVLASTAVIGLIVGFLIDGGLGAVLGLVGAAGACIIISDVVAGASRREGSGAGALAFFVSLAALVVAAIALLVSIVIILVVVALLWLAISRRRRAQRKHAGLRVLR